MFFIYQILCILTCTLKRHLPSCDTSWVHCWVCSDTGHLRPSCTSGWKNYESQSDQFYPGPCSNLSVGLFGQWSPVKNCEATVGGERHGHLLVEGGEVGVGLLVAQLGHPDHALLVAGEEESGLSRWCKSIACEELFAKFTFGDLMQQESFSRINFLYAILVLGQNDEVS